MGTQITAKDTFKTIVGPAAGSTSLILHADDEKEILDVKWSYHDPNWNSGSTAFNPAQQGLIGRLCVFDEKIDINAYVNAGGLHPDASTDFAENGWGVPCFDQMIMVQQGQLWFARDARSLLRFTNPVTIVLCRAWDTPPNVTRINFVPRLTVQWKERPHRDYPLG